MLTLLVMLFVFALVLVVPVMIGARMVGAEKTGFGSALLAVICLGVLGVIIQKMGLGPVVGFIASAVVGAGLLAFFLGTTFWRGMAVSVLAAVLQIGVFLIAAGSIAAMAS
jgi:hypothetical protein